VGFLVPLKRLLTAALALVLLTAGCGNSTIGAASPASSSPNVPGELGGTKHAVIPISLPIELPITNDGITFANVLKRAADIPRLAWDNVQRELKSQQSLNVPATLSIGPTTQTTEKQITELLDKESQLFGGFSLPRELLAIAYNGNDVKWAEGAWETAANALNLKVDPKSYFSQLRAGCNVGVECSGGMTLALPESDIGVFFLGVQEPYWKKANQSAGPMSQVNHEYTHAIQFAQWLGISSAVLEARSKAYPCWWSEGQANAVGIPIWASKYQAYKNSRDYNVTRPFNSEGPKPSLKSFSAKALEVFLEQDSNTCYHPESSGDYQLGYSVGYAAVEVLVAIGGPRATMAVVARTASGDTWAEAFQAVYGITWDEGRRILAAVLSVEYKALPIRKN